MALILFGGLLVINLLISWSNARSAGTHWDGSSDLEKVVYSCGLVMSAAGFTWVYTFILGYLAVFLGYLDSEYMVAMQDLTFALIIIPVVVSGIPIWFASVVRAAQTRSFGSIALASWNTFAQIANIVSLFRHLPDALGNAGSVLLPKKSGRDSYQSLIVVLLVAIALLGGILTTSAIFQQARKQRIVRAYA